MMQIFVKTVSGRRVTLDVEPDTTIEQIKAMVRASEGIPTEEQRTDGTNGPNGLNGLNGTNGLKDGLPRGYEGLHRLPFQWSDEGSCGRRAIGNGLNGLYSHGFNFTVTFKTLPLDDGRTLADYGVVPEDTLHLISALRADQYSAPYCEPILH